MNKLLIVKCEKYFSASWISLAFSSLRRWERTSFVARAFPSPLSGLCYKLYYCSLIVYGLPPLQEMEAYSYILHWKRISGCVRAGRLTDGPYTSYDLNTLLKATAGQRRAVLMGQGNPLLWEWKSISPWFLNGVNFVVILNRLIKWTMVAILLKQCTSPKVI